MVMHEYEIMLEWVGKTEDKPFLEYGFGGNPPIVVRAENTHAALRKVKLNKNIKVKSIKRTD